VTKSIVFLRASVTPKLPVPTSYLPLLSAGRIASKDATSRSIRTPSSCPTAAATSMSTPCGVLLSSA
jgi:hypothetical protein